MGYLYIGESSSQNAMSHTHGLLKLPSFLDGVSVSLCQAIYSERGEMGTEHRNGNPVSRIDAGVILPI